MNNDTVLPLFIMTMPIITALTCIVIILSFHKQTKEHYKRDLHNTLLIFYALISLNWLYGLLYCYCVDILANFNSLIYCTYIAVQVVLYRFTYQITRTPNDKGFSWLHYIIPGAAFFITAIWSAFVPEAERLNSGLDICDGNSEYAAYHAWINSRYWVRFVLSFIYGGLSAWRIILYRREIVNYSADIATYSFGWLLLTVLLMTTMPAISLVTLFLEPRSVLKSVFWILPSLMMGLQMILLCYFTITNYYVVILDTPEENKVSTKQKQLNKKDFEKYIRQTKPYLNPKLKIADLCADLATNRSYLSAFINQEYDVNFSQFINRLRLDELKNLQIDSECLNNDDMIEIILSAGFSSYQSYKRTMKTENSNNQKKE